MENRKKYLILFGALFLLLCIGGLICGGLFFFNPINSINLQPYSTGCLDWDDIDSEQRVIFEGESLKTLELFVSGEVGEVWENSHPAVKDALTKEQFEEASKALSPFLTNVDRAEVFDGKLVTVLGNDNSSTTNIICGSLDTDSPTHLQVQPLASGNKFAITQMHLPGEPFGRVVSIQMAEHDGSFKLVRLEISNYDYKGKHADYYEELGDKWAGEDKLLEAYLAYQFGAELSYFAPFLHSGQNIRLNDKAQEVLENQTLQDSVKNWDVNGIDYPIINILLLSTLGDINMYVKYLSNEDLDPTATKQEAMMLMEYIETEYPDLGTEFDGVLFEAFEVMPTDPKTMYSTYRVPIDFER
jgi:hypothetical protein